MRWAWLAAIWMMAEHSAAMAAEWPAGDPVFAAALSQAYLTNPQLLEQRQRVRETDEDVPRALSGWRPHLDLDDSFGASAVFDRADPAHQPERRLPQSGELALTQPLYTGGRVSAQVGQAKALVAAERAGLQATEAAILLDAAAAYVDVARDQRVVELDRNQAAILERSLRASEQEAAAGALTLADVAQARARLADQRATLAASITSLDISRAAYEQAVGTIPGPLVMPTITLDLPPDLQAALALIVNNYDVAQSRAAQQASSEGIDIVRAGLRPRISFQIYGARDSETDVQLPHQRDNIAETTLQITFPLYQGGEQAAEIRQAKEAAAVALLQVDAVFKQARQQVKSAWAELVGARLRRAEFAASVDANVIAERGIARQQAVGERTLIEVLNAQQEELVANVRLTTARHDEIIAGLRLQAATGRLSAETLGLQVPLYDPQLHYKETRNRWFGTDPAP